MRLGEIYSRIVEEGIKHDPRGKAGVTAYLNGVKKEYSGLGAEEKKNFDKERLRSPFSDTRILYGNPDTEVKNILVGIDMETAEILLADALARKNKRIGLIMAHHPEGFARSMLYDVMNVQADLLKNAGVPLKKAKEMVGERQAEVMRKVMPANTMRPVDTTRLLGIPFMCAHTAADNFAYFYLDNLFKKEKPKTVKDIIGLLAEEPEYRYAMSVSTGPALIHGKPSNPCGKILLEMTGGTEGSKKVFPELVKAGVKTIVAMHMSEEHFKKAKKYSINILIAGHISSDSLGLNLLIDAVDTRKRLNIIPCSGFKRAARR